MTKAAEKLLEELKEQTPFYQYFEMLADLKKQNNSLLHIRISVKNANLTIEWLGNDTGYRPE